MRKACAARLRFFIVRLLSTFPPEMSFLGAKPSQGQKCMAPRQYRLELRLSKNPLTRPLSLEPGFFDSLVRLRVGPRACSARFSATMRGKPTTTATDHQRSGMVELFEYPFSD